MEELAIFSLSDEAIRRSVEAGYSHVDSLDQLEIELLAKGMSVPEHSAMLALSKLKKAAPKAIVRGRQALRLVQITRSLKEELVSP